MSALTSRHDEEEETSWADCTTSAAQSSACCAAVPGVGVACGGPRPFQEDAALSLEHEPRALKGRSVQARSAAVRTRPRALPVQTPTHALFGPLLNRPLQRCTRQGQSSTSHPGTRPPAEPRPDGRETLGLRELLKRSRPAGMSRPP
ncbi:unnamed protein product [Merluccius merluccius]